MSQRPTPQLIGVCALIALLSDSSSPLHDLEFRNDTLTSILEKSVLYPSPETLGAWVENLTKDVGKNVAKLLLDTLTMASESVDALVDLMDSLNIALAEGIVDPVSVHGVFLRQLSLGFEEISFESITFLWQEFRHQLQDTERRLVSASSVDEEVKQVEQIGESIRQSNLSDFSNLGSFSNDFVEEILQEACRDLDQHSFAFEEVELQVRSVLEKAPESSAPYFLRFLNCLRHKDRSALDALHQFFDHTMIEKQSTTKEILQFSAILLAFVHESFGDSSAALLATEEAIRVAQQSKDATCVTFALGKLFQSKGNNAAERRQLLERCATRATEERLRTIVVGSQLSLGLDHLNDPDREPAIVWQHHMESTAEPSANSLPTWDRSTFLSPLPRETADGLARQTLVESEIWNALGAPSLSRLASFSALNCHEHVPNIEKVSALLNMSGTNLKGVSSMSGDDANGLKALMQARRVYGLDGQVYDETFLPVLFLHMQKQAIDQKDFNRAKTAEIMMKSCLPPGFSPSSPLLLELGIQQCLRLYRSHDIESARSLSRSLLQRKSLTISSRAKLLIALASMEVDIPGQGFISALPRVLEGISICEESSMFDLHCVAMLLLSRVHLKLRNPEKALSILRAAMPELLRRTDSKHQAEAYVTQAKCFLRIAIDKEQNSNSQKRYTAALRALQFGEELYKKSQDESGLAEVYYLQARTYNLVGQLEACESASERFMNLQGKREERPLGDMIGEILSC